MIGARINETVGTIINNCSSSSFTGAEEVIGANLWKATGLSGKLASSTAGHFEGGKS